MIYTAIFQNAETGDFSRSVTFDASYSRKEAWAMALEMQCPGSEVAGVDEDYLFCLVSGAQEVWSPDTE